MRTTKVAVVQQSPVVLDKTATIALMIDVVEEAVKQGAQLIVFSETFIAGYPSWVWRLRPGADWGSYEALHQRLIQSSVDLSSNDLAPLLAAAEKYQVNIVTGLHERDGDFSQSTLYNSVVTINHQGQLVNHHRKLMPTNPERMVWGMGDGSGLNVVDTTSGRLGALICWENYMPLARYALYGQNVEIYIAPTYDSGEGWLGTLQHIAREGRCFVLGCGNLIQAKDFPDDLPDRDSLYPDPEEWVNPGDSVVIAPGGDILQSPLNKEAGILYAELDLEQVAASRRALDVAGHYARPDVFQLNVNQQPQSPVSFVK